MPPKIYLVRLSAEERQQLWHYIHHGQRSARAINRARILLYADEQWADDEIAPVLGVDGTTVHRIRTRYGEGGLQYALQDKQRGGAPAKIDGRVEATLTMLACSDPPEGDGRWTLQLLAEKLVEVEVIKSISLESVSTVLKKTN
jgi:transposase